MSNLTRDTLHGFKWTYGSYFVSALLQIGYTAAMARLLVPADFGLVAMAGVFLTFGNHFAQMGIGAALVQKPQLSVADIRTGFTSTVALGLLMCGLLVLAAPLAATLFGTDDVVVVVRVLALAFVLNGFGATAQSLLRRQLRFRALAAVEVGSHAIGYMAVGLSAALLGAGVWSLVAAGLSQSLLASVVAFAAVRHPLKPLWAWPELRVLYSFGGRVSLVGFLEFLGANLDTLFIGRFAGEAALGLYNRAHLLVRLPLDRLTEGTSRVLYPTFSRIQHESQRLRGAYLSGLRIMAVLVIPAAAGMAVAAPQLVAVVLGPQWHQSAQVVPLLALLAAASLTARLAAITCEATAQLNAKLLLQVGHLVVLAVLLAASIGRGLVAYALAAAIAATVRSVAYLGLMRRVLSVSWRDTIEVLTPVLATAGITAAAVAAVTAVLAEVAPAGLVLAAQMLVGAGVLATTLIVGPLGVVRRDLYTRLSASGLLDGRALPVRIAAALLRGGR